MRAIRDRLRTLWALEEEEAVVGLVNDLMREYQALPQVVRRDGWG